jgi:hemerythrin-like domain-containing protein
MNMPRPPASKTTSKSTAKTTYRGSPETDVLALLVEDHNKVKKLFDQFEKMKKEDEQDDEAKQMIVETACAELTIHAQVEEEIFYPAMRESLDDADLLDEAEVEHASAKQLISELSAMQPGDELYDAKFTVLGEYVKHHIEEEEKELFPKAKKEKAALEGLAEEISQRKMELREELGLPSEEEEEEQEAKPASKRKSVH